MAIFRGVGGSGDSSDNSFLQEVTAQANAASASASAASASASASSASASAASASASSILNLTAATGAAGSSASYDASTGVLTIPRGDAGVDAVVDTSSVSAAGALMTTGGQLTGNITFSGTQTVDGRDLSADGAKLDGIEANADVTDTDNVTSAGAAMLSSSPTFTGTITAPNVDISTTGTVTTNIATGTGGSGATKTLNLGTGFSNFFDGLTTVNIGTQSTSNQNTVNIGSGVSFEGKEDTINLKGNVTVDGTLNGGTYERTVRTRFQRRGYSNVSPLFSLTTSYIQVGGSLRINSGATTAVENILDLNVNLSFYDINSTNEGMLVVTVDAPNPSNETTVNLGTVTSSAQGTFQVTGDFTKHFSPYCGMSTSSDGSNSFTFTQNQGWYYDPVTDKTVVFYYPFQTNTPSLGDTVYLHPFDWETQGTEIFGDSYPIEAYNASGIVNQNQFHQIYLGYYKPERTFKIKLKELTTSENIAVTRVAGSYSQIIGS